MALFHTIAGLLAAFLSLLGFVPYILSTLRGENRPNRATWIIWTLIGLLLFFSYRSAGATDALWLSLANVIAFVSVLLLLFKYGEGGWNPLDAACLAAAAFGILLWWYFSSPLPTLYWSIAIDFIGALPTLKKSWQAPEGEDALTWKIFWAANTVNLFALQEWSFAMAAYPLYLFCISGSIALLLMIRRVWPKRRG